MPYIHFTDEQKLLASSVDLEEFLRRQGERLIRSGPEYRMASDHSVTVRGNEWYDHEACRGGGPISFVQERYGLSYPDAVTRLLEGEHGVAYAPAQKQKLTEKKPFAQPPAGKEMRRLYAYLLQKRLIDRKVLSTFIRAGLIYEDAQYHNAVFIGRDEHGVARHAHKRSSSDLGKPFRINVEGSDPRYSFHWVGDSERLYVFEAPIDLLSFLTLYPDEWQHHSYVALCGVGEQSMLWMLEQKSKIHQVLLCLDHDKAGIEATGRLTDILNNRNGISVSVLQPEQKDWNEDLKAQCGLEAEPAEEHPQLTVAPEVCDRIAAASVRVQMERVELAIPCMLERYREQLRYGQTEQAIDSAERAAALALAAYSRKLRQAGRPVSERELADQLYHHILPHRNRSDFMSRCRELSVQFRSVLALSGNASFSVQEEKQRLADGWLELAASFAGVPVKYEAELLEQRELTQIMQQEMSPANKSQ